MSHDRVDKINNAISVCLDELSRKSNQSWDIANFMSRLRNDRRWQEWELREVEEAVQHSAELIAQ